MAHSYAKHRSQHAAKARAHHIIGKPHARGGKVHPDEAEDRKLFKKLINEHEKEEMKVEGHKSGGRLDKFARGGKTGRGKKGHKGNHVNIVIANPDRSAGQGEAPPAGPPPIPPGGGALPPMGPPPGAGGPPPMGGMPMKPPGMMRRGGGVKGVMGHKYKAGAGTGEGRLEKEKAYGLKGKKKD